LLLFFGDREGKRTSVPGGVDANVVESEADWKFAQWNSCKMCKLEWNSLRLDAKNVTERLEKEKKLWKYLKRFKEARENSEKIWESKEF
jgi:hypothetical protein